MEQIDGMPDGFEALRIGVPKIGEWYLNARSGPTECKEEAKCEWLILRKIEKPKQYRPFGNAAEFAPHRDRWVRLKVNGAVSRIQTYFDSKAFIRDVYFSWVEGFECLEFDDGTPFGVEVNE